MKIFSTNVKTIILALCLLSSIPCHAQADEGGHSILLDSVVVSVSRHTDALKQSAPGSYKWNMRQLDLLPKVLGNADPMHYAQMLPGIQTNSEYHSGINIEGCDNSHNEVSVGGVPIYNAGHLLGMFSVFNGPHFSSMDITRSASNGAYPNRIGGMLNMVPPIQVADSASGELSIGLVSSQGTVRTPLGRHTSATVSLRGSYINLLYGQWMRTNGNDIRYSFGDANVTVVHEMSRRDRLTADFYCGIDKVKFYDSHYLSTIKADWNNIMGALHWHHDGTDWHMDNTAYVTSYRNRFNLEMQEARGRMPSGITDFGLRSSATWRRLTAGCDIALHTIMPQYILADNYFSDISTPKLTRNAVETSVYADWRQPLSAKFSLDAGSRISLWHIDRHWFKAFDPSISLRYDSGRGLLATVSGFTRHQYLFQTGFSDAGLPTEFWMPADNINRPQHCIGATAGAALMLGHRMWRLSADFFYRHLDNQLEYSGSMLDCLNSSYDVNQYLLHGKGKSIGFNVMVQKCAGTVTGWCSYTYTRSRRTFDGYDSGTYPANHERPHELNAVVAWSPWRHWTFGATFVYASGTPFTAPESASVINGNVIASYGRHNANRLNAYCRLDASVNYKWLSRKGRENGVNLSAYNATAHRNVLFYRIRTNKEGAFAYRPVTFMVNVLPSVSYYYKF